MNYVWTEPVTHYCHLWMVPQGVEQRISLEDICILITL